MEFVYKAIGIVHSPFNEQDDTPIQGALSEVEGTIEVFPEYAAGLEGLEGFSHIYLIYHFHKSAGFSLKSKPFLDGSQERGIFAIRHFNRPNPVGLSIVELRKVMGNMLDVGGIDVLDGTPLLDIKPYIRQFDCREAARSGWAEGKGMATDRADRYTPRMLKEK
jgi:tRNA (adenine37-N6)-methyltransferase